VPHIELRAKREVTLPFDMSTAYRQTNFRDRAGIKLPAE